MLGDEEQRALYDLDLELRGKPRRATDRQPDKRATAKGGRGHHAAGAQQPAWWARAEYDTFASMRDDFGRRSRRRPRSFWETFL